MTTNYYGWLQMTTDDHIKYRRLQRTIYAIQTLLPMTNDYMTVDDCK